MLVGDVPFPTWRWHTSVCVVAKSSHRFRGRYMQGGANELKTVDSGAAVNMHLAASLFVLQCQADVASESAVRGESPSRRTLSPPSASSPPGSTSDPKQGSRKDVEDGNSATSPCRIQRSLACVVEGAARTSVVATELSNAPMVDLVAGILDAEAIRLREEGMGGM